MTLPAFPAAPAVVPSPAGLVLDTNILIYGVRGGDRWQRIKDACDPLMTTPKPAICVVSEGELRSFAEQQDWGAVKRGQMQFLLDYFDRFDIRPTGVMQAYAAIDAYSRVQGVRMGKNDLWIAAVTYHAGATLVTTDRDFEHLHGVFLSLLLVTF